MRSGCPSEDVAVGRQSDRDQCTCTDSQVADYFCKLCQSLICDHCKSTKHRHHDTQTVHIVAADMRNYIQKYDPENLKTEKMDSLLNATHLIKAMKTDLFALQMHEIDRIDERLNELHQELDGIHSKLVGKVMDIIRKDAEYLNREERILNRTAASITRMCDAAKHLMTEADDIDVITRGYSVCEEMDETLQLTTPVKGQAFFLEFIPGGTEHSRLDEMFGDISVQSGNDQADTQTPKHSQPTTSDPGPSAIGATTLAVVEFVTRVSVSGVCVGVRGVCATADDKCWVTDYSPDINLVDVMGTRHRTVTMGVRWCTDITTDGRTMYVTCGVDRSIKNISTDHKVTNNQTSLYFSPVGLTCVPATGELLVCGLTDGVFSVTDCGVQRTLIGIKFQDARDIAVSNNGDICVTDGNKVFIFNSDKRHIGTYDGHRTSMHNTMDAWGVTCDSRGYFIIADYNNHMLHFINRDGYNVSIYDTTKDCEEKPHWIDISPSGRLWVSFGGDKICVYGMI